MRLINALKLLTITLMLFTISACSVEVTIPNVNDQEQEQDPNEENGNEEREDEENEKKNEEEDKGNENENENGGSIVDDGTRPAPNYDIAPWNGATATDGGDDSIGSDADIYHEANNFTQLVVVRYNGSSASISTTTADIESYIDGAHVTIDMASNSVSGVEIIALGTTTDGSLKIYGEKKYKLSLYGVDITSKRGPAINSQCKKRVFVDLAEGTTNRLTDCSTYSNDAYTMPGAVNEDRKGALFTEGHLIISGRGTLVVAGKQKHAIATDGYYYQRAGATVVVTETAKNAIQVKGDEEDGMGAYISGGAVVARVASEAGKGIKSDLDIVIAGGLLDITTSGNAYYDSSDADTSSAAALKSDRDITINGGTLNLSSSGTGGKGINADVDLTVNSGDIRITTSGTRYEYNRNITSSPKGIKVDGNIVINGGTIDITVSGRSEGSEGMESKSTITFTGGETMVNAYDDGINATSAITINGGRVYTVGSNNDGMDSNGSITMNGGLVIGVGSNSPETGVDVDRSDMWKINGGTMIGFGGSMMASPSTASTQCMLVYNGLTTTAGNVISILDSTSTPIVSFEYPLSKSGATLLVSCPEIVKNSTFTVVGDGTLNNPTDSWMGWLYSGTWSGGTTLTTFTPTSIITSVGSGGGGGPGGGGGGPGGPGGGDWPGGGGGWPW